MKFVALLLLALLVASFLIGRHTPGFRRPAEGYAATPEQIAYATRTLDSLEHVGVIVSLAYGDSARCVVSPAWRAVSHSDRIGIANCVFCVLHFGRGSGTHVAFVDSAGREVGVYDPAVSSWPEFR